MRNSILELSARATSMVFAVSSTPFSFGFYEIFFDFFSYMCHIYV